jgi:8-oxo-dGTP pyrophosphatase MutT (NUDIX family)
MALLARRLRQGLPGVPALLTMAPPGRGYVPIAEARAKGCREAAALVLIYPHQGQAHVVLTLRHADLTHHASQVSFPGGRCDPGEAPVDCALREAFEELAVPPAQLALLGPLTPVYIAPSSHCVQAFLATMSERPTFQPAATEVAAVIEVPLAHVVGATHRQRADWVLRGEVRDVPFFLFDDHRVWGATAMLLAELGVLWADVLAMEALHDHP